MKSVFTFTTLQSIFCVVDLLWLYFSYPPFYKLSFGVEWIELNGIHLFLVIRSCYVLTCYYIWQRVFCLSHKHDYGLLSLLFSGIFVNWLGIVLFGGYILTDLQNTLFLSLLLASEWWILCNYLPYLSNPKHEKIIQLVRFGKLMWFWALLFT